MNIPYISSSLPDLNLLQTKWRSIINSFMGNPSLSSIILPSQSLINGTTVINHKLGRKLQGYRVVRQRASASIYDQQDSNQTPALTLVLVSSAAVVVDIEVF